MRRSAWVALGPLALAIGMIGFIAITSMMPGAEALPSHSNAHLDMIGILGTVDAAVWPAGVGLWPREREGSGR